jgi:F-type H+-transporting ATPase subunit c
MNVVRKVGLVLVALTMMFAVVEMAVAQEPEPAAVHAQKVEKLRAERQVMFGSPGWGAGIGAGMVIIGAAIGFGRIGSAALESMARQPETAGRVQTAMIIIGALLEGATFFALIVCIQIAGKA